jgi:hypothetical protein
LREACQRPGSRFAINYEDGFAALLPHLAKLKASSQFLSLHAEAELELGNTEAALEDIKIAFRLIEAIRTEPILISQLVRMAMLQILLNPVWQGLADHRWNEAQLLALDQEFRRMDFLADYQLAMRGERAMGMWAADFVRRTRDLNEIGDSSDEEAALAPRTPWFDSDLRAALVHLMPGGWFEQNKLSLCRGHEKWLLPLVDAQNRRISPSLVNHSVAEIKSRLRQSTPFNFLGRLSLPGLSKSSYRFALTQASVDLARVACALERYRLAHGQYPEAIDALAPPFIEELPHDLINGQPLKYRRTDPPATGSPSATANQFILYSVGWNETDDGGQIGLTEKGGVDSKKGDWVWQFTEK